MYENGLSSHVQNFQLALDVHHVPQANAVNAICFQPLRLALGMPGMQQKTVKSRLKIDSTRAHPWEPIAMDSLFKISAEPLLNSSLEMSSAKGIMAKSKMGEGARLAIVDADGNILDAGPEVANHLWNLTSEFYSRLMSNSGKLHVYTSPPCIEVVAKKRLSNVMPTPEMSMTA